MTELSNPCHVVRQLTEDLPGQHWYVFNYSNCNRDVSDEWLERHPWGQSETPAVPKLDLCPLNAAQSESRFFTLGYGGTPPEKFISLLQEHQVQAVADVRLWPHRASMGSYVLAKSPERGIQRLLMKEGIQYQSLVELGNPFIQFQDWKSRYRQLLSSCGELLTERLLRIPGRCCLLCSEKQPEHCHRSIIAEFLAQRGYDVEHLAAEV
jgi:hypothetical protein